MAKPYMQCRSSPDKSSCSIPVQAALSAQDGMQIGVPRRRGFRSALFDCRPRVLGRRQRSVVQAPCVHALMDGRQPAGAAPYTMFSAQGSQVYFLPGSYIPGAGFVGLPQSMGGVPASGMMHALSGIPMSAIQQRMLQPAVAPQAIQPAPLLAQPVPAGRMAVPAGVGLPAAMTGAMLSAIAHAPVLSGTMAMSGAPTAGVLPVQMPSAVASLPQQLQPQQPLQQPQHYQAPPQPLPSHLPQPQQPQQQPRLQPQRKLAQPQLSTSAAMPPLPPSLGTASTIPVDLTDDIAASGGAALSHQAVAAARASGVTHAQAAAAAPLSTRATLPAAAPAPIMAPAAAVSAWAPVENVELAHALPALEGMPLEDLLRNSEALFQVRPWQRQQAFEIAVK